MALSRTFPIALLSVFVVATAHAETVQVDVFAEVVQTEPPSQNPIDRTTVNPPIALTVPQTYSATMTLGDGNSNANTTVSLGTIKSYAYASYSTSPSITGYSESAANVTVIALGTATSTTVTPSALLTGSFSTFGSSGSSAGSAVLDITVYDLTNNTSTFYNMSSGGSLNTSGPLSVSINDQIELSVVFDVIAYQSWYTDVSPAFADYSHTLHYYLTNFQSDSGFDYNPDAPAAIPLPATLPLFATGLGALGLLGWRRKRKATA